MKYDWGMNQFILWRVYNSWVRDILQVESSRLYNLLEDLGNKAVLGDISN
jgi:hypothetical protein